MDSIIYSLNATFPVFFIMVLGYILKKRGILDRNFVKTANKLNYNINLPALLFIDLALTDFKEVFDLKYVIYCAVVTFLCIIIIWIIARVVIKDKSIIGEFIQASYRGSAAVLGAAFLINISGTSGMAPLMILGSVPIYNIFAVIILTIEREESIGIKRIDILKSTIIDILSNPIIISIFIGMLFSIMSINMPEIISKTIQMPAKMSTPLALLCIGASFSSHKALAMLKPTLWASFIKLFLQPAIFLPLAIYLGFTGDKLLALIIMLGAPTTPSSFIMAKNLNHEGSLTTSIVAMTIVLSAFTVTTQIFIVKQLGLV